MSDFSDREDHQLVMLAREYEDRGEKVSWAALANAMKYSKKDARALRRRLATLKTTNGKLLRNFPSRFFKPLQPVRSCPTRHLKPVFILPHVPMPSTAVILPSSISDSAATPASPCAISTVASEGDADLGQRREAEAAITRKAMSAADSSRAVSQVFAGITKSDVRQAAGRTEYNVGELSVDGVTSLIDRCQLQQEDIFFDVGSGIGNVVAQVALQTDVSQAIGIDIRGDVASLGAKVIKDAAPAFPRLLQAVNYTGDVVELAKDWSQVACTTVLYANNFVFTQEASLAVHNLCCMLPGLRLVVLGARACPRHSLRCTSEFCLLWQEEAIALTVKTEYKHRPVSLHVYTRRTQSKPRK